MGEKPTARTETTRFLAGVTFLGGFLDAYTYLTRGGVFANNHTGNMAKLGITLAQGKWGSALDCLVPILCCIAGAAASEVVHARAPGKRDWRCTALLAELLALSAVAFLPRQVPNGVVNGLLSFITGFQLCLFRTSRWGAHNTTICTGNLRTVGQFLYGAMSKRDEENLVRFIKYTCLVFSFVAGAGAGVPVCGALGPMAALVGAAIAAVLLAVMAADRPRAA